MTLHLEEWKDFKIESSHAYLGSPIGPGAGDSMWDKPISKYWGRVRRIAACGLSAYYSILAYNTYAVSCLEYRCQLYWVPPKLLKLEARAIAWSLKIPSYAFGKDGPFKLKEFGILSIRSILAMNLAAMFRAARVTLKGWNLSWGKLLASLNDQEINLHIDPSLSHRCWDSPPIASRLFCAFNGFRDNYLQCIPMHILRRIKQSFPNVSHLEPYGPILSPEGVAPDRDPIYRELMKALRFAKGKPQKDAYHIFLRLVHPMPFPELLHKRALRWTLKYFQTPVPLSNINNCLEILRK